MASPMMYEMLNAIMISDERGAQFGPNQHPGVFVSALARGLKSGHIIPLDVADLVEHYCRPSCNEKEFLRDGEYVNAIIKTRDGSERLPFPCCFLVWRDTTVMDRRIRAVLLGDAPSGGYTLGAYALTCLSSGEIKVAEIEHFRNQTVEVIGHDLMDVLYHLVVCINACSNATWPEVTTPRTVRRRHERLASVRFRTVSIDTKKREKNDRRTDAELATGVAWHRRRGHIAVYTSARPGRTPRGGTFIGRVWRHATEVGDKKHGIIVQDYTVKPPEQP